MLSHQPKLVAVFYAFQDIDKVFEIIFTVLDADIIQQKISKILLDLSKKIEVDLPKVENLENLDQLTTDMVEKLPSFFFFNLFWTQYLNIVLNMKTNTVVARELFSLINKLILETNISS